MPRGISKRQLEHLVLFLASPLSLYLACCLESTPIKNTAWCSLHMRDTITQNLGNPYYDHKTL